jgi:hypothetical protein
MNQHEELVERGWDWARTFGCARPRPSHDLQPSSHRLRSRNWSVIEAGEIKAQLVWADAHLMVAYYERSIFTGPSEHPPGHRGIPPPLRSRNI